MAVRGLAGHAWWWRQSWDIQGCARSGPSSARPVGVTGPCSPHGGGRQGQLAKGTAGVTPSHPLLLRPQHLEPTGHLEIPRDRAQPWSLLSTPGVRGSMLLPKAWREGRKELLPICTGEGSSRCALTPGNGNRGCGTALPARRPPTLAAATVPRALGCPQAATTGSQVPPRRV